jgi:hypothetical protein
MRKQCVPPLFPTCYRARLRLVGSAPRPPCPTAPLPGLSGPPNNATQHQTYGVGYIGRLKSGCAAAENRLHQARSDRGGGGRPLFENFRYNSSPHLKIFPATGALPSLCPLAALAPRLLPSIRLDAVLQPHYTCVCQGGHTEGRGHVAPVSAVLVPL